MSRTRDELEQGLAERDAVILQQTEESARLKHNFEQVSLAHQFEHEERKRREPLMESMCQRISDLKELLAMAGGALEPFSKLAEVNKVDRLHGRGWDDSGIVLSLPASRLRRAYEVFNRIREEVKR